MILLVPVTEDLWVNPELMAYVTIDEAFPFDGDPRDPRYVVALVLTTGQAVELGKLSEGYDRGFETRGLAVEALERILDRTFTETRRGPDFASIWEDEGTKDPYVEALADALLDEGVPRDDPVFRGGWRHSATRATIRDPDVTESDDPQAEDKPGDNRTDLNNGKDPE